jgi:hypothetical protein
MAAKAIRSRQLRRAPNCEPPGLLYVRATHAGRRLRTPKALFARSSPAAAGILKIEKPNNRTMLQKCSFFGRKITKMQKFLRLYSFFDPFKPVKRKSPKITVFLQDFAP